MRSMRCVRMVLRHNRTVGLLVNRKRQEVLPDGHECIRLPKLCGTFRLCHGGIGGSSRIRLRCRQSTRKSAQRGGHGNDHVATVRHFLPPNPIGHAPDIRTLSAAICPCPRLWFVSPCIISPFIVVQEINRAPDDLIVVRERSRSPHAGLLRRELGERIAEKLRPVLLRGSEPILASEHFENSQRLAQRCPRLGRIRAWLARRPTPCRCPCSNLHKAEKD